MKSTLIILAALMLSLASVDAVCTLNTKADKDKCEFIPCNLDSECEKGHCRELLIKDTKQCMLRATEGMACVKDEDCDTGSCSKGTFNKCLAKSYLVPILIVVIVALLVIVLVIGCIWKRN